MLRNWCFLEVLRKLEIRELENLEKKLLDDSLAMLEAEILFTRFITNILTEDFQITPKYSATEFVRRPGRYKDAAKREPIAVTSHGRPEIYLLSPTEFEHYRQLMRREREAVKEPCPMG